MLISLFFYRGSWCHKTHEEKWNVIHMLFYSIQFKWQKEAECPEWTCQQEVQEKRLILWIFQVNRKLENISIYLFSYGYKKLLFLSKLDC